MNILSASSLGHDGLQAPLEAASDALARLDERMRVSPVAEAFRLRAHFDDACAALWRGNYPPPFFRHADQGGTYDFCAALARESNL